MKQKEGDLPEGWSDRVPDYEAGDELAVEVRMARRRVVFSHRRRLELEAREVAVPFEAFASVAAVVLQALAAAPDILQRPNDN